VMRRRCFITHSILAPRASTFIPFSAGPRGDAGCFLITRRRTPDDYRVVTQVIGATLQCFLLDLMTSHRGCVRVSTYVCRLQLNYVLLHVIRV
jgi:hypothetical protein